VSSIDAGFLRKLLNIKLYFEAPSDWSVREFIEIIDDYFMERLPVILNNLLGAYGLEASILEEEYACKALKLDSCKDLLVVAIYGTESNKALFYALYTYRVGDNTFEFQFQNLVNP
jgi:hypothetical protein